jgi:hypothetical protein
MSINCFAEYHQFIADELPGIAAARAEGRTVHDVTLYERMASRWLERDAGKHRILPRHKMSLATHLAAYLWWESNGSLEAGKLEDWLHEWLEEDPALQRRYRNVSADQLEEDLRTATFLVRKDGRSARFRFAHTSLLEFFLAKYLFTAIGNHAPECWQMEVLSRGTRDFLGQMLAEAEDVPAGGKPCTSGDAPATHRSLLQANKLPIPLQSVDAGQGNDLTLVIGLVPRPERR